MGKHEKTVVSTTIANPIRTAAQGGAGWLATEFIDAWIYDMNDRQYGIAVLVIGALVSLVQNYVENRTGKAILRDIPQPDAPIVETGTPVEDTSGDDELVDELDGHENDDLPAEPVPPTESVYSGEDPLVGEYAAKHVNGDSDTH